MTRYSEMTCEACRVGAPPATDEKVNAFLDDNPEWVRLVVDGEPRIQRVFEFENFEQALSFTNRVGALAEEQGHHPALLTEWGRVTVGWWTHKIRDLHINDLIMAGKTDLLAV
ncbi:MAG: 4a-hydroxytetrahydrobiopterin dehydratase [Pseudomonadota bacterium]|jgi:4a-hydroxytetrahydrobiopterin dehydratase|nr:4a-hydroxytetrahydrobiopterin dehydratase [Rhodospirillaceae bacterium]MEC7376884.1 4a-hydroxytetrahydrobiopterin dehydratase [Pseudomonadota bacterium]|tara:strand:+ start:332 stop:670 length:339 start_codon:yes stop_codon:yes gene_type:complete